MTLDRILASTNAGSGKAAISNTLRGINADSKTTILDMDTDNALVLFTRPMLNLINSNIRNIPKLYNLMHSKDGLHRYIRMLLDPNLKLGKLGNSINSKLIDNENPFMPVFTNLLTSLSGWPDEVTGSYTSKEGIRKEKYIFVDGASETNRDFTLDATFRNTRLEPVKEIVRNWYMYETLVAEGKLQPYYGRMVNREIDYSTRIYVLVLNSTRRKVIKIAAIGGGYPLNNAIGKDFEYNRDNINRFNKETTVRFLCVGAMYNDPYLIHAFNQTVATTCSGIRKWIKGGHLEGYVYLTQSELEIFNFYAIPIIDYDTLELKWIVKAETYDKIMKEHKDELKQV